MFNKETKIEKFKDAETIIGNSIKVKGNFHGQGNIIVEGNLEGSLRTEANLFIGEKAKIVANIEAVDAIINGDIKGNLKIHQYLVIGAKAKITGDINYSEISIEKGAIINGQLICSPENSKGARNTHQRGKSHEETDEEVEINQ